MDERYTLAQLEGLCGAARAEVVEWVELGVVEPEGGAPDDWRFAVDAVPRLLAIARLAHELELPPYAAALVHDLLAEKRRLERRLAAFERRG